MKNNKNKKNKENGYTNSVNNAYGNPAANAYGNSFENEMDGITNQPAAGNYSNSVGAYNSAFNPLTEADNQKKRSNKKKQK